MFLSFCFHITKPNQPYCSSPILKVLILYNRRLLQPSIYFKGLIESWKANAIIQVLITCYLGFTEQKKNMRTILPKYIFWPQATSKINAPNIFWMYHCANSSSTGLFKLCSSFSLCCFHLINWSINAKSNIQVNIFSLLLADI